MFVIGVEYSLLNCGKQEHFDSETGVTTTSGPDIFGQFASVWMYDEESNVVMHLVVDGGGNIADAIDSYRPTHLDGTMLQGAEHDLVLWEDFYFYGELSLKRIVGHDELYTGSER